MTVSAQGNYLETQILTATPQKLRLMLIDAAIRSARRTKEHWLAEDHDQACTSLIHAQRVVSELLGSINREASPELGKKMAAVYMFIFRSLSEAGLTRDVQKIEDAVVVLEEERETWRQVCEKLSTSGEAENPAAVVSTFSTEDTRNTSPLPDLIPDSPTVDLGPAGFSLEA